MKRLLFMLYVMFLPICLSVSELSSQYRYHKFGCDRKVCWWYWGTWCQNKCPNRNYIMCMSMGCVQFSQLEVWIRKRTELLLEMQSDKKVEIGTQKSLNLEKTYPKKSQTKIYILSVTVTRSSPSRPPCFEGQLRPLGDPLWLPALPCTNFPKS